MIEEPILFRILAFPLFMVLLPLVSFASPYPVYYFEDFEDDELSYGFYCSDLVDEPPGDPSQSYAMIVEPAWDGTSGLFLSQGNGDIEPSISVPGCAVCSLGSVDFELGVPPGRSFGAARLVTELYPDGEIVFEYEAPGAYSVPTPGDVYVLAFRWIGHDVVVDDLLFHDHCDCDMPNECASWGVIKAAYR